MPVPHANVGGVYLQGWHCACRDCGTQGPIICGLNDENVAIDIARYAWIQAVCKPEVCRECGGHVDWSVPEYPAPDGLIGVCAGCGIELRSVTKDRRE
jgi:hypothetical protein